MKPVHYQPYVAGRIAPVQPNAQPQKAGKQAAVSNSHTTASFSQILDSRLLTFSNHAEQRLQQRGIRLQHDQLVKLSHAVDKAEQKGAKDSLLFMKDMAFIVNIKSRTVITALTGSAMKDNVFTQIDSAVVVD
ncbi:flagellar protein [Xylanibacillus composti]|uniref:Flagellar protein n=1 Tax=Xylanibacillus composti TaxID=1572762 RepID=A0A8J4H0I1_9BACL|nr:TIGR02530 family flagellar biosynthesis protein [Xylanibacillus composti]GIQ68639.1 flagellar protein [Xylanibacillus composti]